MKTKIKQSITAFLAVIASTFIIFASVAQWIPSIYLKTAKEMAYTMQLRTFLQNSEHLQNHLQKQNKDVEYETD